MSDHPKPPTLAYKTPAGDRRPVSGAALASMVLGILGFIPLVFIPGIIYGVKGLRATRDPSVRGRGLAIGGLVLGSVSFVVSLFIISILLLAVNRARESANRMRCQNNMWQIGKAILLYCNENQGYPPPKLSLLVTTQGLKVDQFCCPSSGLAPGVAATDVDEDQHLSYVYVLSGEKPLTGIYNDFVVLYEKPGAHGDDGINFLFADGHAEFYRKPEADQLLADIAAKRPPAYPVGIGR